MFSIIKFIVMWFIQNLSQKMIHSELNQNLFIFYAIVATLKLHKFNFMYEQLSAKLNINSISLRNENDCQWKISCLL